MADATLTLRTQIVLSDRVRDFGEAWIACPACNRKSPYRVGRIRHNPHLSCPACWTSFLVEIATDDSAMPQRHT